MEVYYVIGGCLAGWALIVSALGIFRPSFPGGRGGEVAVAAISAALVLATISSAVIGSINEGHEEDEGGGHEAALVLPR